MTSARDNYIINALAGQTGINEAGYTRCVFCVFCDLWFENHKFVDDDSDMHDSCCYCRERGSERMDVSGMADKPKVDISEERYRKLMSGESLTPEEIADGWHFCCEWDGLLIHPSWREARVCACTCTKSKGESGE